MAQRGFMSASAMGTLMSQSTRDAQAAIRSQLANIDAQKAQALVEAPYKQFEVARNMLSGVETQKGVEQAARDFLLGFFPLGQGDIQSLRLQLDSLIIRYSFNHGDKLKYISACMTAKAIKKTLVWHH